MASLLDRMGVTSKSNGSGVGPVRSKSFNRDRSSPYNRGARTPRGDINGAWSHDLFESNRTLSERLSSNSSGGGGAPRATLGVAAQKALRDAVGVDVSGGLNIKGASSVKDGNVVQVSGLVKGTSPADVEAIFKRCGPILSSKLHSLPNDPNPIIRIIFKTPASAATAVQKFHNQQADGRTISVSVIGGAGVSLGGRLGGLNDIGNSGSVDALMDDTNSGGSKMRSDAMISDPRASVQIAPPGADPREYTQQTRGGGRGRGGRGRGRRGGDRDDVGKKSGMDID